MKYWLIKKWEGLHLEAYICPAGKPTIGWGNTTYENGRSVQIGDKITQERAEQLLDWYCSTITLPKGNFTENQKEALYSLIYNIGQAAFNKSNCKKAIEAGDFTTAKKNWDWIRSNGKVLPGLVNRRKEEKRLFFGE